MLESLIRAGAFDAMGVRRSQLLDAYGAAHRQPHPEPPEKPGGTV
ncbi:MAG: hypothetical protein ACLT3D_09925 [Lawsonibacter sp.]